MSASQIPKYAPLSQERFWSLRKEVWDVGTISLQTNNLPPDDICAQSSLILLVCIPYPPEI